MPVEPLIFRPGDEPCPPSEGLLPAAEEQAPFALDPDRTPWLRDVSERELAHIAVELTDFICRPSFGSRSKREIELRTFALLRAHRPDWTSLGEIADDLAISRSKARSLSLDFQSRQVGGLGRGARRRLLRDYVRTWPKALIEYDEERLRLVIDDPFMRDLLKNFAFARGILIDHSFAPEIQIFKWSAYAALLEALYLDSRMSTNDFQTMTADLRHQLLTTAGRDALADAETKERLTEIEALAQKALKTKAEQRKELVLKLLNDYGPVVAKLGGKALMPT